MSSRIAAMPSMPPAMMTHSFGDIATATRIESIAKTMSVSSTLITVVQNADRPGQAVAVFGVRRSSASPLRKKCWYGRQSR